MGADMCANALAVRSGQRLSWAAAEWAICELSEPELTLLAEEFVGGDGTDVRDCLRKAVDSVQEAVEGWNRECTSFRFGLVLSPASWKNRNHLSTDMRSYLQPPTTSPLKEHAMPTTTDSAIVLTLDCNDVLMFVYILDGDDVQLDERDRVVADALLERLLETCDDLGLASWIDEPPAIDYQARPAGALEFPLVDDELETLWRLFDLDPGTEGGRSIWMNAMRAVELGTLTSDASGAVEANEKVRLLAEVLLHRAWAYAQSAPAYDALELVYATLAAHWLGHESATVGASRSEDLGLAMLVARGALKRQPEKPSDALFGAIVALQDEWVHGGYRLSYPCWYLDEIE